MRHLVARLRSDRGTTLTELMVVTMLFAVVLVTVLGALVSMTRNESTTTNRFTATSEAQTIADRLTKDFRTAVAPCASCAAFTSAGPQDVTFYANLSDPNGPTKLHAYVSTPAGSTLPVLLEDATPPDANSAPNFTYNGVVTTRFDGQYLDASGPIFSYFDTDGNTIAPDSGSTITTTSKLQSIDIVGVNLVVHVTATSPRATIATQVHLRNTDYHPGT